MTKISKPRSKIGAHVAHVLSARRAACVTAIGLAAAISSAYAQQAPTQTTPAPQAQAAEVTGGLEEIVITATKRSQSIQNVPIAVTAFSAEALQSKNLSDVHSLSSLTPGVNLDSGSPFSGDRSVLSASIRGIGQDDFAMNLNPGVGVYLDGVYLARTIGSNLNLLDVDRVEILKGPQGTLFGANTIGGAISIVTHTPGNDTRIVAEAVGGKYNRRDVSFTADLPLIQDTLLSSITVASQNQTGWQKVIPYPAGSPQAATPFVVDPQTAYPKAGYQTGDDYGGTGVVSMRGKLLWNVSDKLALTFTGDWSHEDQTALPNTVLGVFQGSMSSTFSTLYNLCLSSNASTINQNIATAGFIPGVPPAAQPFAVGTPTNTLFAGVCSQPRAHVPSLNSVGGAPLLGAGFVGTGVGTVIPNLYDQRYNAGTAGAGYLGSSSPRLFFDYNAVNTGNIDTTYATGPDFAKNDVFGFSLTGVYSLSDNLQFKSISGYRQIKWNIGTDLDGTPETLTEVTDTQHQWQVSQEFQLLGKALDGKLNWVAGLYYFDEAGYVHDYVPFESLLYVYDVSNDVENVNYAAFVHADWAVTDHLGVTLGGRYTDAQTYFLGGQSDLNSFPLGSTLGPALTGQPYLRYFPNIPDSQAWHIFDPTVGLQWHFNNDTMAYASWGKGFKAGGWTTRLSAVLPAPADARYGPEYSKTYELGLKSTWLDRHLITNAAIYYTDYTAIQLNIQQGISPVYTNAGDAKIKGAELEFQSIVGNTGLNINGSAAYIDAYYTYVNPNANIPQSILPDGTTVCPTTVLNNNGAPVCPVHEAGVTQLDAKLPKTPKYKLTIDPEYSFVMSNQATLRFIAAYTYIAEMFNDSLNTPQLRRPASRDLSASIHYVAPNDRYDFAVGGTNLTDDRYVTAGSPNTGSGVVDGYYNPPRMWYVSLRVAIK
jgi:iron complex outermembrane receptor protein